MVKIFWLTKQNGSSYENPWSQLKLGSLWAVDTQEHHCEVSGTWTGVQLGWHPWVPALGLDKDREEGSLAGPLWVVGLVAFGQSLAFSSPCPKSESVLASCSGCYYPRQLLPEELATHLSALNPVVQIPICPSVFLENRRRAGGDFLLDTFCKEFVFGFILSSEFCEPTWCKQDSWNGQREEMKT